MRNAKKIIKKHNGVFSIKKETRNNVSLMHVGKGNYPRLYECGKRNRIGRAIKRFARELEYFDKITKWMDDPAKKDFKISFKIKSNCY